MTDDAAPTVNASVLGFIDGTVVAIAIPAIRASLDASLAVAQWVGPQRLYADTVGARRSSSSGVHSEIGSVSPASSASGSRSSSRHRSSARSRQTPNFRSSPGRSKALALPSWCPAPWPSSHAPIPGKSAVAPSALGGRLGADHSAWSCCLRAALDFDGEAMWRWIFAVNPPLDALAILLLRRAVDRDPTDTERPIDMAGALLATLPLLSLAWGLTQADRGGSQIWIWAAASLPPLGCVSVGREPPPKPQRCR